MPGVEHRGLYTEEQINPVFWDKRHLDLQCESIAKLGEYLDGWEGFEFIDLRCIGEWIENYVSGKYDLGTLGQWQQLTAIADVPIDAATAHLAIGKGAHSTSIDATIRLDDVKLELIEAP